MIQNHSLLIKREPITSPVLWIFTSEGSTNLIRKGVAIIIKLLESIMIPSAVMMTDTRWGQLRRISEYNDLTFFHKPIGLLKAFSWCGLYSFNQVRESGLNILDSLAQVMWRETQEQLENLEVMFGWYGKSAIWILSDLRSLLMSRFLSVGLKAQNW